jgi:hypothetical protein
LDYVADISDILTLSVFKENTIGRSSDIEDEAECSSKCWKYIPLYTVPSSKTR